MEFRHRNLQARRRREPKSLPQVDSSKPESRCQENLFITGVRSCFVERRIHFQFRPKLPGCLVLECRVPLELPAQLCGGSSGKVEPHRGLNVKSPPALAKCESGRQHGVAGAIAVRSRGRRGAKDKRQQVISFFAFSRNNAEFQHQRYIAKSAGGPIRRAKYIRRYPSQDLSPRTGDELKPLTAAKLISSVSLGCRLVPDVVTQLLLQPAGCSCQGRKPIRLFGLRFCGHLEPGAKETAFSVFFFLFGFLRCRLLRGSRGIAARFSFCCGCASGGHLFLPTVVRVGFCCQKQAGAGQSGYSFCASHMNSPESDIAQKHKRPLPDANLTVAVWEWLRNFALCHQPPRADSQNRAQHEQLRSGSEQN
jgi:hypothetical protein